MNLNPIDPFCELGYSVVSIPIRDLMNLNLVLAGPALPTNTLVSIPIRDLMNLNPSSTTASRSRKRIVSIPIRDLMNLNRNRVSVQSQSAKGFQSLLGI